MGDEQQLDQLSRAVSGGFLSNDVVLALSRLARNAELRRPERQALTCAAGMLEAIAESAPSSSGMRAGVSHLNAPVLPTDALSAARTQSPDRDALETCRALAKTIRRALEEKEFSGRENALLTARSFFASIADLSLSRANEIGRGRDIIGSWSTTSAISSS